MTNPHQPLGSTKFTCRCSCNLLAFDVSYCCLPNDDWIKSTFVNNKTNWEHAYPVARTNIVAKLYRLRKLELLKLDTLTDSACKDAIHAAGIGYAAAGVAGEPGLAPANSQFKPQQFSRFRAGCWDDNVASVTPWTHKMVKNIPADAFNDLRAQALLNQRIVGGGTLFAGLNAKQVAAFITNPKRCNAFVGLNPTITTRTRLSSGCTTARV